MKGLALGGSSIRIITLLLEDRQVVPIDITMGMKKSLRNTEAHQQVLQVVALYDEDQVISLSFLEIMIACPIHQP